MDDGWLGHRRDHWPRTPNPHLPVSEESALHLGPPSHALLLDLRKLAGTLECLHIGCQLEEAIAAGGNPLHLAAVFGISEGTAVRYAVNARKLLHESHAVDPPDSP